MADKTPTKGPKYPSLQSLIIFIFGLFNDSLLSFEIIKISEKTRLRMGQNGRKHILEKFSYPIIKKKYIKILQDAIALKKSSKQ